MNDTQPLDNTPLPLRIEDLGAASKLTRGYAWPVPYFENGVPPYDRFWPYPPP
jgi:hypothetical protein